MKTIGKLAKELDLGVETIRFYEREGLIKQPQKPQNGYRVYDDSITKQLQFICKAKALGLRDPHKLLPHIIHTLSDRPVSSTTELSTAKFALALADNIAYLY